MEAERRRGKALGEPYDGKRHVRFDEGVLETEVTARSSGTLARKGRNGPGSQGLMRPPRQRPTLQLRNLEAKVAKPLREELREDYRRMVYAKTEDEVKKARAAFTRKWKLRCPEVVRSLDEAGDDLFTFLRFPESQWKSLRTTNALERVNEEFRRRTKTQSSLPNEASILLLLFGLLRSGKIKMRKIDGWQEMPKRAAKREAA
ncbi:MAG: transposase [Armatimonadota bacterium]